MKYEKYIKDGLLAWTLTSNGYKFLTWNLVLMWNKVCSVPLCIVCADRESFSFLQREGISCVMWDTSLVNFGPQIVPFGSRQFVMLNRLKLTLLNLFAKDENIKQCLYLDGDIAVYKDIVSGIRSNLSEANFWAQCDEQGHECSGVCPNFCTGLLAWNHGADLDVFKITDMDVWKQKPEDQVWVNYSAKLAGLSVSILPRDLYPNGARASLTKNTPELNEKAICLHYNYRVGDSKKADMKRFGDWQLIY